MKYSIITVNYNNKEGLRQTIESVIHQTFRRIERIRPANQLLGVRERQRHL